MLLHDIYGIDLGSSTVKIYSVKKDEVLIEKNMIAIREEDDILAVGNLAYEMYEKSPHNVTVTGAVSYGMIANIMNVEIILHLLLRKINRRIGRKPSLYFAVSTDMTEIEKRAYHTITSSGDLRKSKVYLVEKPIADAIGLGLPIMKTKGSMLVNVGGESTEISVVADQRVIISKVLPIGGNHLDHAICNAVRKRTSTHIGHRTGTRLKNALACFQTGTKEARKVVGIDSISGLPKTAIVTTGIVNTAIGEPMRRIAEEIQTFLERTPPQIRSVILQQGIYLTGGCTRISHMDSYLSEAIGCKIQHSSAYELSTIYGLKEIMTHKSLHHWAVTPKSRVRRGSR